MHLTTRQRACLRSIDEKKIVSNEETSLEISLRLKVPSVLKYILKFLD